MAKKKQVDVRAHKRSLPKQKDEGQSPGWGTFLLLAGVGGILYLYKKR